MSQIVPFSRSGIGGVDASRLSIRMNEVVIETCDALDRMERLLIELQLYVSQVATQEGLSHHDAIAPLIAFNAAFRGSLGSGWTAEHRALAISANMLAMERGPPAAPVDRQASPRL